MKATLRRTAEWLADVNDETFKEGGLIWMVLDRVSSCLYYLGDDT